ncbi:MAG: IreB family regulatory phosphoprotein [Clostridia bacterium]|nr:IreB family regulatory phosphoprotein [Clostridia bacterium]
MGGHVMNTEKQNPLTQEETVNTREILREVYEALTEKGYNPIGQIVGYLLSEDPTYITNCNNARALIRKIDRDELMGELVKSYLELE